MTHLLRAFPREIDEVAEWLRRWTANPMCSARVGSNPILVVDFLKLPAPLFPDSLNVLNV